MRKLCALLSTGLLVVALAVPAAGASHSLKATFDGPTFPPVTDEGELAARCPAGSEWIFGGVGTGEMKSAVYSGVFEYENDHCSRWVVFDPERTTGKSVGKAAAGMMTVTIPGGDELELRYEGTWVLEGVPPDFDASIRLRYRIVDGSGIFAGATGSGRMHVFGGTYLDGEIKGSIHVGR
jgi:hypothetical protein